MSVIRFPRNDNDFAQSVVVFVDLQREYVTEGRAPALSRREPWWSNCRRLLDYARDSGLPVAHFRLLKREPFFNRATPFADWIEEFRPRPHEMVFERSLPSCYSNESFATLLNSLERPNFLLAGLTADGSCLATMVDAYHRNHRAAFVADASDSRARGGYGEEQVHGVVTEIAAQFGVVTSTSEIVSRSVGRKPSLVG